MPNNVKPFFIAYFSNGICALFYEKKEDLLWKRSHHGGGIPYDSNASEILTVPPLVLPIERQSNVNNHKHQLARTGNCFPTQVSNSRLNCAPVDNNSRPIVAYCCNETSRHVLIASRDRNISIIMLSLHNEHVNQMCYVIERESYHDYLEKLVSLCGATWQEMEEEEKTHRFNRIRNQVPTWKAETNI